MPSPISRTGRHSFASTAAAGASRPYGPRARTTSRGMNDAVLRASAPPQVRPRGPADDDKVVDLAHTSLAFITAYTDFSQGVIEGFTESLKSAWGLVSHDMWQARTYKELAATVTALSLMTPFNLPTGLAAAKSFDRLFGTNIAQRQLDILQAVNQLIQQVPRWTSRQWGHAVGRVVGDVLLAKGAGAGVKMALQSTVSLARATATVEEGINLYHSTTRAGAAENILKGIDPKFFNPNSRFGPAFYTATQPATTTAELAHHGFSSVNTIQYTLGSGGRFLNLTSPLGRLGTRYTPKLLARYARFTNKNAIIAHSLRLKGGVNVIILEDFTILENGFILP